MSDYFTTLNSREQWCAAHAKRATPWGSPYRQTFEVSLYSAFANSSAKALVGCGLLLLRLAAGGPPAASRVGRGRLFRSMPGAGGGPVIGPAALTGTPLFDLGGCAGLARSMRSSRGARSNRRMIEFISSTLGASMNANPLDSCVSGLRMTLIESATRFSAESQDLISSAVTQAGRLPRKTVLLIRWCVPLRCGGIVSRLNFLGKLFNANT